MMNILITNDFHHRGPKPAVMRGAEGSGTGSDEDSVAVNLHSRPSSYFASHQLPTESARWPHTIVALPILYFPILSSCNPAVFSSLNIYQLGANCNMELIPITIEYG